MGVFFHIVVSQVRTSCNATLWAQISISKLRCPLTKWWLRRNAAWRVVFLMGLHHFLNSQKVPCRAALVRWFCTPSSSHKLYVDLQKNNADEWLPKVKRATLLAKKRLFPTGFWQSIEPVSVKWAWLPELRHITGYRLPALRKYFLRAR